MELAIWQLALLGGVGVLAGWLNVLAGGGSMLTVPVMLFMGLPGPVANGTNRIAILAQNVSALTAFWCRGFREWRLGLSLSAAAIPGAVAGSLVGVRVDGAVFEWVLAVIMLGLLVLMGVGKKRRAVDGRVAPLSGRARWGWGHFCMVGAGFWGGFIQIGVGFVLMPILHRVLGLDLVRVNALKVFVVGAYTLVALAIFAGSAGVVWAAGLALAAGNAIGGWLGAHTSVRGGEGMIRWVFNILVGVFIIKLLFF
ncbi:MAG: sulfite exporter TauE/SafE family protein [Cellvibrionales bacterium]|nr:sulfite exporter TauE/SafE family protein [Cellvibrionales bacterium]